MILGKRILSRDLFKGVSKDNFTSSVLDDQL